MADNKGIRQGRTLVIVESPAKAKTIAGYLGKDYMVESSIGHVRDLPHSAAEVPAAQKQEPWARLGVNVDQRLRAALRRRPEEEDRSSPTCAASSPRPTSSCSRQTKTAKARRSPGTSSRC